MASRVAKSGRQRSSGNLRIGDHWNAITIIALSQSNPLKAVAELVENSIDARARTIVITRGKEKGQHYLRVKDDGEGVRRNADGEPDFHYVATHVCDSIKRQLKVQGAGGLQGEFGIGLLSFWTLGEELLLTSASADGRAFQMHLKKGDPSYRITHRPTLFAEAGSEVLIRGILPGIKNFSGDKIQWYLASELRDRIRHSGVSIRVVDRTARAEYKVEPRQFEGRLLHELDGCLPPQSDVYAELYLHAHLPANAVSLYRSGTRVLANLTELEAFARIPWTSGYVQGIIDAPYLNLTPGTRLGVIHDAALARLAEELRLARGASREDHRGPAAGRGRAGESRCAPLGARGTQGGAAGPAGGGVRLVRSASRRGQAAAAYGGAGGPWGRHVSRRSSHRGRACGRPRGRRRSAAILRVCGSAVFGDDFPDVERHRSRWITRVARDRSRPGAATGGG